MAKCNEMISDIYSGFPILFLGSGFSTQAINKLGQPLMTGSAFSKMLLDELNISREYPLDIVAREYKSKFGEKKIA